MSFTNWLQMHHLIRSNRASRIVCASAALAAMALMAPSASAAYVTIYGGPTYTPGVGGLQFGGVSDINDAGTAVGGASKYNGAGRELGSRGFRLDGSGSPATELENLGTYPNGSTESVVYTINNSGTAVGSAEKHGVSGVSGPRAVRWDASGTAATELGHLGTTPFGFTYSYALSINDAGTAFGYAAKYDDSGIDQGHRVVRWDASGTAATELGNLGTSADGFTYCWVYDINDAGTAAGYAQNYDSSGVELGVRAVRWDGSGTAASELENLGTDISGHTESVAYAINNADIAVGQAKKFDGSGVFLGFRAVRWDASGTAATELGNLGSDSMGFQQSAAEAINDAGMVVGYSVKYDGSGAYQGPRAVRWHASGTAATELGILGADASGCSSSEALAVNDAGIAIGYSDKYDGAGTYLGPMPVYWGLDGVAVDLNTLIDPTSGWTLNAAGAISDTGWIGGQGMFDPDGPGGQEAYFRSFLIHVPATAVPEPATVALIGIALVGLSAAWRRRAGRCAVRHLLRANHATRIACAAAAALAAITLVVPSASAVYVNIFGGPTFAPVDGFHFAKVAGVNDAGAAVGNVYTEASAIDASFLAVRWDSSGAPAIELGLGGASDINEDGTAVGYVTKIVGTGDSFSAAVRWDTSGAATELMILGTPSCCVAEAYSINNAGVAVGAAEKYGSGGSYQGYHAVRWDPSGTAATQLESPGGIYSVGTDINDAGVVVGYVYTEASASFRAVRWEASGTAVIELDNLGTNASGVTETRANDINTIGTAVGWAIKYDNLSVSLGQRAVRWNASGATATELGSLGTNPSGIAHSTALAINDAGTAIGQADKHDGSGAFRGLRAVRWNASGTTATELGNLGTNEGFTETNVFAINDAGIAVGYADEYDGAGTILGERAVYWSLDGAAVDLNTLIDPVSGWTLNQAHAISNTGWIGGSGAFDPDGPGGQEAYARLFLIQLPAPSDLPGDYNGNRIVDVADYTVWRDKLGSTTSLANDDTPGVGPDDYIRWKANFGQAAGNDSGGSAHASVPEPATIVLLIVVTVGMRLRRRCVGSERGVLDSA